MYSRVQKLLESVAAPTTAAKNRA